VAEQIITSHKRYKKGFKLASATLQHFLIKYQKCKQEHLVQSNCPKQFVRLGELRSNGLPSANNYLPQLCCQRRRRQPQPIA